MNEPLVKRIVRLRFRRMRRYFHSISASHDVDAIHDFRVEFKRLRAFLRLLSADTAHKGIKIPDSLHKMYQAAGAVRDLQLHKRRIDKEIAKSGRPAVYIRWVRHTLNGAAKDLDEIWHRHTIDQAQKKIEKKIKSAYPDNVPSIFVSGKIADVHALMSHAVIRDMDLHAARKAIKDIVYNARIFKEELKTPFAWKGWTAEQDRAFNKLADQLGKFQDTCTILVYLKVPPGAQLPEQERLWLGQVRKQQLKQKRALKKLLLRKLSQPEST